MEYGVVWKRFCQLESRKAVLVMGIIACSILLFQSFTLPNRIALFSLTLAGTVPVYGQNSYRNADSSPIFVRVNDLPLSNDLMKSADSSVVLGLLDKIEVSYTKGENDTRIETEEKDLEDDLLIEHKGKSDDYFELDEDRNSSNQSLSLKVVDLSDGLTLEKARELDKIGGDTRDSESGILLSNAGQPANGSAALKNIRQQVVVLAPEVSKSQPVDVMPSPLELFLISEINGSVQGKPYSDSNNSLLALASNTFEMPPKGVNIALQQTVSGTLSGNLSVVRFPLMKKNKGGFHPISIAEMNRILIKNDVSSLSMKPRRSSARDRELLSAKAQIENAPIVKDDPLLYAPLFRNVSRFKRSYELMERILKVYVYKDGEKPIFHQPLLRGIYASEGWFMKVMERSKHFLVKDPRKAHLFYLPFSTRMLQFTLYVPHSHSQRNLAEYLKKYVDKIAAKYPFWNRTGGADHFLAACHDWAPFETRPHLESTIRALCNADISGGFKLGKDVSLPETYIRSARNPQRDLGGNPANERTIFAFYAGGVHGLLRQALLQYWENRDPIMKIFGSKFLGIEGKMAYIQHMKSSKYCICPRGYEVNSPRVVEAIFYECVPVIISDNFVPPLFEVLDWEAFAVFVAEKDITKLKDILLSISEEKYLTMQMRVKRVQHHFLWHANPVRYDLFHMILHSVWLNRLNQIAGVNSLGERKRPKSISWIKSFFVEKLPQGRR